LCLSEGNILLQLNTLWATAAAAAAAVATTTTVVATAAASAFSFNQYHLLIFFSQTSFLSKQICAYYE
jgi:hypothetical protein